MRLSQAKQEARNSALVALYLRIADKRAKRPQDWNLRLLVTGTRKRV